MTGRGRDIAVALLGAVLALCGAQGHAATLAAPLSGLAFLVGDWEGGGPTAQTGGSARGRSHFGPEAGGAVLLRRDHTDLFDRTGKAAGGFDQIMMIYPEGGGLHADYSDGSHVIHYVSAAVAPGRSVVFESAPAPQAPRYRLAYEMQPSGSLTVTFSMAPPGGSDYRPIATGTLTKVR